MSVAQTELATLRIEFGSDPAGAFSPGIRVLAGDGIEALFSPAREAGRSGDLSLFRFDGWLLGAAHVPLPAGLEIAAHRLYADILRAARGQHLVRIWNYVPAINETDAGGLEHYRLFCRGRSLAFEEELGADFKALLPAASAVGCQSARLTVVFAACLNPPRHVENPLQVPAYDYPREYGPRAPSFARATIVPGVTRPTVFISGTAAIRGHATVAPHRTREQLECTLDNLREISLACGIGPRLGAGERTARHFKVYLRHASDQPMVAARLEEALLQPGDAVSYLHADICRAELQVEIEATLF